MHNFFKSTLDWIEQCYLLDMFLTKIFILIGPPRPPPPACKMSATFVQLSHTTLQAPAALLPNSQFAIAYICTVKLAKTAN